MKLTDYIREWPNAFTANECSGLVEYFEHNKSHVKIHDSPNYKFEQLDVNNVDPYIAQWFAKRVDDYAKQYFRDLKVIDYMPVKHGFEDVRIKKYELDCSEFRNHVDVGDYASARLYLIFILYLDDNEWGGTIFPQLDLTVKCEKGKLICFPPTWQYPHAGLKPKDKPKYIMMTCLHYL